MIVLTKKLIESSQYGRPIGTHMVVYLQIWSPLGSYLRLLILLSDSGILKGGLMFDLAPEVLNTVFSSPCGEGGGLMFDLAPEF